MTKETHEIGGGRCDMILSGEPHEELTNYLSLRKKVLAPSSFSCERMENSGIWMYRTRILGNVISIAKDSS